LLLLFSVSAAQTPPNIRLMCHTQWVQPSKLQQHDQHANST